jgi:hypothetical protein
MSSKDIEKSLGIVFPAEHWRALLDPSDPIHAACDFLVLDSPYKLLRLQHVNEFLHVEDHFDPWPGYLVAFASNGCGDYFAYDIRQMPYTIIYIDPDKTVAENLGMDDRYTFHSFAEWHAAKCEQYRAILDGRDL